MDILLVEDDYGSRRSVKTFLKRFHHHVTECADGDEALAMLGQRPFDLILSDIRMPKMTGLELLKYIKQPKKKSPPVVLFTGCGTIDTAIEALRLGAFDYLVKPVDAEQLVSMLERVEANLVVMDAYPQPVVINGQQGKTFGIPGYSTTVSVFSKQMEEIYQEAQKYGVDRSIPVLIRGETGTGKEVIARIIHNAGENKAAPFVDINCAAITPSLFESELFGYEAGTFTGGQAKGKKGKFDIAAGGTMFLDEIAEIPLELQGKLLRVLQEKEYYRVGGLHKIKTDTRIICATNVNLEEAVEAGRFRRDLYYRLKVGQLYLPPLRNRVEEIIPLATTFLREFAESKNKSFQEISPEAATVLSSYPWPGNIRELRNVIERAVFLFNDFQLRPEHFGDMLVCEANTGLELDWKQQSGFKHLSLTEQFSNENLLMDEHIITLVEQAVEANDGNKAAAARSLGIARSSIYRILDRKKKNIRK